MLENYSRKQLEEVYFGQSLCINRWELARRRVVGVMGTDEDVGKILNYISDCRNIPQVNQPG